MDFGAAMKTSWKMVNKHWWQVFGLSILISLVNVAGICACCVGVLFTIPIGFAALMIAYETIFGAEKN
jgi:NhaP-type Na+/H+ or K+/H+ antiporter